MVERSLSMREVRGSIPRISISCFVYISALIDPNINQIFFFSLWGNHLPMGLPLLRTAKANGSLEHTHQPNPAPSTPDTEHTFDWTTWIKAENEANKITSRRTWSHQKQYLLNLWSKLGLHSFPSPSMLKCPNATIGQSQTWAQEVFPSPVSFTGFASNVLHWQGHLFSSFGPRQIWA